MNETLPPPASPPPAPPADQTGLLVACATIIILAALAAGGYLLWQELQRMATAKPAAPPEVTQALSELRSQLDRQRADSTTQLQTLQSEIASLKQQQAEQPAAADIETTLAPVQEKLDAIAQKLETPPPLPVVEPIIAAPVSEPPPIDAVSEPTPLPANALRDYLTLRRTVESGAPYAAELAVLIPQLPDTTQDAIATLQAYAEHGIGNEAEESEPTTPLAPWMESINQRFRGLVSIRPAGEAQVLDTDERAEVMAALDAIEASLVGQP